MLWITGLAFLIVFCSGWSAALAMARSDKPAAVFHVVIAGIWAAAGLVWATRS